MSDQVIKFIDEEDCRNAIKDVRNEKGDIDWAVISYEGPSGPASQRLKLLAKGGGGISKLKEVLADNIIGYALLRETDQIDESITVKFVFINWLGDTAPRMQKSRISIHLGPIRTFIGQFHVDLIASNSSELTHEIIMQKIMDTSGSGSRVIDHKTGGKQLNAQVAKRASVSFQKSVVPGGGSKSAGDQLVFPQEDDLTAALKDVRTTDSFDWVLFTYENPKTNNIVFLGKGNGGVAEMSQHLVDDIAAYGLVKKIEVIDESQTIKFCFVCWVGENVNRMLRARLGVHKGAIQAFFAPYHVDINCSEKDEITDDIVLRLIKTASGSQNHVLSDERTIRTEKIVATKKVLEDSNEPAQTNNTPADSEPVQPKPQAQPKPQVQPKRQSVQIQSGRPTSDGTIELGFDDEEKIYGALKTVRDDKAGVNWVLVGYDAPRSKTLTLIGSGSGGMDEFISNLKDDMVGYGLVRLIEQIDNSQTVKFAFINWVGQNINRMQRAVLGTHKGFIDTVFYPFHVDHNCETLSEISEEIIMAKVKKAAGTAIFVLN